jgi:hypothetical protein
MKVDGLEIVVNKKGELVVQGPNGQAEQVFWGIPGKTAQEKLASVKDRAFVGLLCSYGLDYAYNIFFKPDLFGGDPLLKYPEWHGLLNFDALSQPAGLKGKELKAWLQKASDAAVAKKTCENWANAVRKYVGDNSVKYQWFMGKLFDQYGPDAPLEQLVGFDGNLEAGLTRAKEIHRLDELEAKG